MKLFRLKTIFVMTTFTTAVLFSAEPSPSQASSPPQQLAEETKATPPSVQVLESIPNITTKKDIDKQTDVFLRGGFCVITALLFLAGFLVVKNNSGQKVNSIA